MLLSLTVYMAGKEKGREVDPGSPLNWEQLFHWTPKKLCFSQNSTKSLMKSAPSVTLFHVFCPVVKSQKINSNTLSISTMIRYRVQDILSPFRLTSPLPGPNSRCWLSHSHHTNDRLAWHVKWKNGSAFPCHCWTPLPKPSGGRGWLFEKWDLYTDSSRDRGKVVQRNP